MQSIGGGGKHGTERRAQPPGAPISRLAPFVNPPQLPKPKRHSGEWRSQEITHSPAPVADFAL